RPRVMLGVYPDGAGPTEAVREIHGARGLVSSAARASRSGACRRRGTWSRQTSSRTRTCACDPGLRDPPTSRGRRRLGAQAAEQAGRVERGGARGGLHGEVLVPVAELDVEVQVDALQATGLGLERRRQIHRELDVL